MKKVVLWGTGFFGKKAFQKCAELTQYEVVAWCDSDVLKQEKMIDDIPVISPEKAKERYEKKEVDMVVIAVSVYIMRELYMKAIQLGFDVVYMIPDYIFWEEIKDEAIFYELDCKKPLLEYYEFHITDHCNLNCKGCGHVSNICEPYFPDLLRYVQDMNQLKKLYSGCVMIKLLGGEPLLNPQLPEFIKKTREIFPECDLRIGTNGLMIHKLDSMLFEVMRNNHAYFFISSYPPVEKIKDEIIVCCEEHGVKVEFSSKIEKFSKRLYLDKRFNRQESYERCREDNWYCFTLREGRISPCATFYFKKLNDIFNAEFEITSEDDFDIYQIDDAWKLDKLLHSPIPFCEYCGLPQEFQWEAGRTKNVTLDDYVNQ